MRKLLLFALLAVTSAGARAQTVSTFESLSLATADTYYVNYSNYGADVGFEDGAAYFPCVYDTAWGQELWTYGFAYSNMTDTLTAAYTNQYSARPGKGYGGSEKYVVVWEPGYLDVANTVRLTADSAIPVQGCYVTNSTYAYYSMRDGDDFSDAFNATDRDWFRITAWGYRNGTRTDDSVSFYLADFRDADPAKHYIVDSWEWMDLTGLGKVDSVTFALALSDENKPMYFCMDNFTAGGNASSVRGFSAPLQARIYPNPASETLYVEGKDQLQQIRVFDLSGKLLATYQPSGEVTAIATGTLPAGSYLLHLQGVQGNNASVRFQKQ